MPTGKATIIGDSGLIATSVPTPVSFIASSFPTVLDGMIVYFERRSSAEPTKAKLIRPATASEQLTTLATPSLGLTSKAKGLVMEKADDLSGTVVFTPGDDITEILALEGARTKMANLGETLENYGVRVGVAQFRSATTN